METLTYLYAIVPEAAPEPPPELHGLDGGTVRLLPVPPVAAVVGEVPAAEYDDEALNARLDDLVWVGERGLDHERVLDWYAEHGPVIPLSLFSLHRDTDRVEARVAAERESFARVLERLRGRREWGIKLWRIEEAARSGIDRASASLAALSTEIERAAPGRRFLLEKRRTSMRDEELRAVSKRVAHEAFAALDGAADAGVSVPLPTPPAGAERTLLLHAAFLVPEAGFDEFQRAVAGVAGRVAPAGFEVELTGPWPPYHFTSGDDG